MTIQVITGKKLQSEKSVTISSYSKPMALDDFDINVIDLSVANLWYHNDKYNIGLINTYNDLFAIKEMIKATKMAKVIYAYPMNLTYHFDYDYDYDNNRNAKCYRKSIELKQMITDYAYQRKLQTYMLNEIILKKTIYEPTKTKIGDIVYDADFHFSDNIEMQCITKSLRSEKVTTVKYNSNLYFTTLDICKAIDDVKNFVDNLFGNKNVVALPEWVKEYNFGTDEKTKEFLKIKNNEMNKLQNEINKAEKILEENNKYKSILCSNGDKLVEVVFEILENILKCDLSGFVDRKNEDFLIKKDGIVLIGEIKGVTSNVESKYISQLDVHYHTYIDSIQEDELINNVHALLIINPLRNKELQYRESINDRQIELAKRNGSLIIETVTLLKIFELYKDTKITTEQIINILTHRTGLLKIENFD